MAKKKRRFQANDYVMITSNLFPRISKKKVIKYRCNWQPGVKSLFLFLEEILDEEVEEVLGFKVHLIIEKEIDKSLVCEYDIVFPQVMDKQGICLPNYYIHHSLLEDFGAVYLADVMEILLSAETQVEIATVKRGLKFTIKIQNYKSSAFISFKKANNFLQVPYMRMVQSS